MGWLEDLARRVGRDANVSTVVNVASGKGARTSVHRHQRVVQRDGERTEVTETRIDEQEGSMSDKHELEQLSAEELEAQGAEQLPDREAMSLINANVAAPVNAAVALNVLSDDSTATAEATQTADIDQGN
jgi:hypothetical protein